MVHLALGDPEFGDAITIMEEQVAARSPSTAAPSATAASTASSGKSGQQLLHELLAVAYHVFEEAKYMNLKPPLQPSSKLFATDSAAPASPSRSPPESPQEIDNTSALESNGHGVSTTNATTLTHAYSVIGQPVIPYLPEEIQDTYTKIAALKNQYVKISTELLELLKQKDAVKPEPSEEQQKQTV